MMNYATYWQMKAQLHWALLAHVLPLSSSGATLSQTWRLLQAHARHRVTTLSQNGPTILDGACGLVARVTICSLTILFRVHMYILSNSI